MEPNKILSASLLELVFDNRNKAYGAYELRMTYPERIKRSIIAVFVVVGILLALLSMNRIPGQDKKPMIAVTPVELQRIDDPPPPEKLPEPVRPQPPVRTEQYVANIRIVPEEVPPLATTDDLDQAQISNVKTDGPVTDDVLQAPEEQDGGKKIIESGPADNGPLEFVEVDAKFLGDWTKFLYRNLNANVPVDHEAPAGRYTVVVEFVVDLEGNVSDIRALTSYGYGMEEEALRVIRKAAKWEPAFQNGHHVKAFRKQPITFIVEE